MHIIKMIKSKFFICCTQFAVLMAAMFPSHPTKEVLSHPRAKASPLPVAVSVESTEVEWGEVTAVAARKQHSVGKGTVNKSTVLISLQLG